MIWLTHLMIRRDKENYALHSQASNGTDDKVGLWGTVRNYLQVMLTSIEIVKDMDRHLGIKLYESIFYE